MEEGSGQMGLQHLVFQSTWWGANLIRAKDFYDIDNVMHCKAVVDTFWSNDLNYSGVVKYFEALISGNNKWNFSQSENPLEKPGSNSLRQTKIQVTKGEWDKRGVFKVRLLDVGLRLVILYFIGYRI